MDNTYLFDTNAVIALLKGNSDLKNIIRGQALYIPIIVLGELYFGAENSRFITSNLEKYYRFSRLYPILRLDEDTTREYARIRRNLKVKGKPINENDYWIAALAIQHKLILLTQDSDFQAVDGLAIVGW
jgi:tRNA(fMet)-specific endonuclease VapC